MVVLAKLSGLFSILSQRAKMWLVVKQLGMKPAWCGHYFICMTGRTLERRMQVNSFPSIERWAILLWLLQINLSPLFFQKGKLTTHLQKSDSSSWIQTWLMIWWGFSTSLRSSAVTGQTPKTWPFFKDFRAALTSAAVTGGVRLLGLLLSSMLSVLSKSSSAWAGDQFSSCWKCSTQWLWQMASIVRLYILDKVPLVAWTYLGLSENPKTMTRVIMFSHFLQFTGLFIAISLPIGSYFYWKID